MTSEKTALRRMHRITADRDRPFDAIEDLLDLGRAYLGVDVAYLTEIADRAQSIVAASGDHELLRPGISCPLSEAYCRKTIEREDALTVQHAAIEGWEADAAYGQFGPESYIAAKVVVDGEVDGTVCFADSEPRDEPSTEDEETFVGPMAEWVSYERFRERATERIERQYDRLEEFASVVGHDLRNPLGVARGYLDLADEPGDPEQFDRCRNAPDRMESLADDLLVLAREGGEATETESVALADPAEESREFVTTGNATLRVESDLVVTGDVPRLRQPFENLFRNGVERGSTGNRPEPGDGVEHGSTGNRPEPGDGVERGRTDVTVTAGDLPDGFHVEDDGPAIPPEERERAFEDGYSTAADGTGFGLAIVARVVDADGWSVRVTEGTGGGARFEITGVTGADA